MAISVDEILDAIAGMTVLELSDLKKKFEEKFDVTAAAPVAMMAAGGAAGGAGAAAVEEEKARRRSRSSRLCASSPAWVSRKPRTSSMRLRRPFSRRPTRLTPRRQRLPSKRSALPSPSSKTSTLKGPGVSPAPFAVFGPFPSTGGRLTRFRAHSAAFRRKIDRIGYIAT
jgi:Ribosomal protein L7/L12 dimerisation domain